jgi:hypothetical protein
VRRSRSNASCARPAGRSPACPAGCISPVARCVLAIAARDRQSECSGPPWRPAGRGACVKFSSICPVS